MKVRKKDIPFDVIFARTLGSLESLEGVVRYEPGDALATGSAGEHWVIGREDFAVNYLAVAPTIDGNDGRYIKKPLLVEASRISADTFIALPAGRGMLKGDRGNWLITDANGDQWVVQHDIFKKTYEIVET